jgi:hypothetical protein
MTDGPGVTKHSALTPAVDGFPQQPAGYSIDAAGESIVAVHSQLES